MLNKPRLLRAAALSAAIVMPMAAIAQDEPTSKPVDLPAAEDIFMKSFMAMGGEEGWEGKDSMSFEALPPADMMGDVSIMVQCMKPAMLRCSVTIPDQGAAEIVLNGEHAWGMDPGEAEYSLPDEDGQAMMMSVMFAPQAFMLMSWQRYPNKETSAQVEFGGNDCYKVEVSSEDGSEAAAMFFNVESGQFAGVEVPTPFGDPAPFVIGKWVEMDGVQLIRSASMDMMGQSMEFEYADYVFNNVDASVFDMPAEVKELLEDAEDDDDQDGDDDGGV